MAMSDIESVRLRPGMFFGSTEENGLHQLALEILANAIDQAAAGLASEIRLYLDDGWIIVEDNGSGFPLDRSHPGASSLGEHYLTSLHKDGTADGHIPHLHPSGLVGVGLAAVCAVSEDLRIVTQRDGIQHTQLFRRGVPEQPSSMPSNRPPGTQVYVRPDPQIFNPTIPIWSRLRARCFELSHLLPGVVIHCGPEQFLAPNGLLDLAYMLIGTGTHGLRYVQVKQRLDFIDLDLVLCFSSCHGDQLKVVSFCNGSRTRQHGSHLEGVQAALSSAGLRPVGILLHTIHHHAHYSGPTRGRLDMPAVAALLEEQLPALLAQVTD